MVAALIHSNMPVRDRRRAPAVSSSSESELGPEESEGEAYIPSPVGKGRRQLKLDRSPPRNGGSGKAGRYNATLVVAPTSLLNQWKDELKRSSDGRLNVLVYNDQKDISTLVDELDAGVDVVVVSYGKIGNESTLR